MWEFIIKLLSINKGENLIANGTRLHVQIFTYGQTNVFKLNVKNVFWDESNPIIFTKLQQFNKVFQAVISFQKNNKLENFHLYFFSRLHPMEGGFFLCS